LPRKGRLLFVLVTTLFFLWAIPNNLNNILIRQFMKSFVMTRFEAGLIQSAFYMGYFLLALPAGMVMRRLGYKSGFIIGLFLFSLGAILFWPAAIVGRYAFFLAALFIIASGLSFLETAANPFIAQWSYFIPYVQAYTNEPEKTAGFLLTISLVLFGVGRFVSAWLMRFIQPSRLMAVYAFVNTALAVVGVLVPGWTGAIALLLTSFFMSLMYPTIFAQGIRGLGEYAKIGGSLIVMAIVGGAVLTPLTGLLSVRSGSVAIAYAVPAVAYVVVACYSFVDIHLLRSVKTAVLPGEV